MGESINTKDIIEIIGSDESNDKDKSLYPSEMKDDVVISNQSLSFIFNNNN